MSSNRETFLVMTIAVLTIGAPGCGDAPDIPHAVSSESDDTCKSCHDHGIDNAPSRHDEDSGCVGCHAPTKRVTAPKIAHSVADPAEAACLACHGSGDNGAPVTKHPGWPTCTNCHTPQ